MGGKREIVIEGKDRRKKGEEVDDECGMEKGMNKD